MTIPKNIIYPISHFGSFLRSSNSSDIDFRRKFTNLLGNQAEALPIGRARSGIYLLSKYAISDNRKKVILSPYSIPDVVNMVLFAGGEPLFVDTVENSTNVSLEQLEELIDDQTACVFVTHYHVNQDGFSDIKKMCEQRDVLLFDDCAISLGGTIGKQPIGTAADASVFSLSAFKFLNYYWGGVLTSTESTMMGTLKREVADWSKLRQVAYLPQMWRTLKYDIASRKYVYKYLTHNLLRTMRKGDKIHSGMVRLESTELDSTLLSLPSDQALIEWTKKFDSIFEYLKHRRMIAGIYNQYFKSVMVSAESSNTTNADSCFVNYPIVVDEKRRDKIYMSLISKGFDVGLSLYPNIHEDKNFEHIDGYSHNVSKLVKSVLTLPTHPQVNNDYAQNLARIVSSMI